MELKNQKIKVYEKLIKKNELILQDVKKQSQFSSKIN
jgi:hypothetical protein